MLTFLQNGVLNYLPDAYPNDMASVMAGNAFVRFCFGAGFPLFAPAMYKNLGIEWASTLLALLGVVFVPIPFAFYYVSVPETGSLEMWLTGSLVW